MKNGEDIVNRVGPCPCSKYGGACRDSRHRLKVRRVIHELADLVPAVEVRSFPPVWRQNCKTQVVQSGVVTLPEGFVDVVRLVVRNRYDSVVRDFWIRKSLVKEFSEL